MNYRGSSRKLLENAKAAMISALEIYNKPTIRYRDECFVILLLNAWELALKAILSKHGQSIFYPKKRKAKYRTLTWQDAFVKAESYFPKEILAAPVRHNLELLGTYRDNTVHFYNEPDFGVLVYALAQTCITNFRDLLSKVFKINLEDEITWRIIPLGIAPPIDPISYMKGTGGSYNKEHSQVVSQFLGELSKATSELKDAGVDTGRLLTIFSIKLESTKKIDNADVVVGVSKGKESTGPLTVVKVQDPNKSHPLRQKDILQEVKTLVDKPFTQYTFAAIVWKHSIKSNPQYCWEAEEGILTKYSRDVISWLKTLKSDDIDSAIIAYRHHLKEKRKKKST